MDMEKLVALCRRRGFIFQSSEIYGGINGFWDYGPMGVELKRNIKEAWWQDMVRNPPPGPDGQEITMVGVDCAIIMNPKVWEASGHVGGFADPMVDCKETKARFRADQMIVFALEQAKQGERSIEFEPFFATQYSKTLGTIPLSDALTDEELISTHKKIIVAIQKKMPLEPEYQWRITRKMAGVDGKHPLYDDDTRSKTVAPGATKAGTLTAPRAFNLMFKTFVGAVEDASAVAYLRPETAQGIFANFKNVLDSTRVKLPFGIAQVGKAFRNEINPRNYTFRSREFEQMEIEFFCHPAESMKWYQYWRDLRKGWYSKLGLKSERLKPREQGKEELAHYSIGTTDIEYLFPFSEETQELEGVAHRGDYDLRQHMQHSGKDLTYFEEEAWAKADKAAFAGDKKKEQAEKAKYRFLPHVIEPSAGADRFTLAVLCEAYAEDEVGGEARTVMRFHPRLAPVKAAVLPLVNKEGMPEVAYRLYRELKLDWNVFYDDGGAIGRRYRRQDEIGTPFCFTVDGQTLQDQTVTLRERDSAQQTRLPIANVAEELRKRLR
jgi:glycyl-tRNA synthetase